VLRHPSIFLPPTRSPTIATVSQVTSRAPLVVVVEALQNFFGQFHGAGPVLSQVRERFTDCVCVGGCVDGLASVCMLVVCVFVCVRLHAPRPALAPVYVICKGSCMPVCVVCVCVRARLHAARPAPAPAPLFIICKGLCMLMCVVCVRALACSKTCACASVYHLQGLVRFPCSMATRAFHKGAGQVPFQNIPLSEAGLWSLLLSEVSSARPSSPLSLLSRLALTIIQLRMTLLALVITKAPLALALEMAIVALLWPSPNSARSASPSSSPSWPLSWPSHGLCLPASRVMITSAPAPSKLQGLAVSLLQGSAGIQHPHPSPDPQPCTSYPGRPNCKERQHQGSLHELAREYSKLMN